MDTNHHTTIRADMEPTMVGVGGGGDTNHHRESITWRYHNIMTGKVTVGESHRNTEVEADGAV